MNTLNAKITKYCQIDREQPDRRLIEEAGEIIRQGGLVAFPTETVYGLGANGLDENAVQRIFQAKGRPADNPLILHIADRDQLSPLVREVPGWLAPLLEKILAGAFHGSVASVGPSTGYRNGGPGFGCRQVAVFGRGP